MGGLRVLSEEGVCLIDESKRVLSEYARLIGELRELTAIDVGVLRFTWASGRCNCLMRITRSQWQISNTMMIMTVSARLAARAITGKQNTQKNTYNNA